MGEINAVESCNLSQHMHLLRLMVCMPAPAPPPPPLSPPCRYGQGCNGGDVIDVVRYMAAFGLPDESCQVRLCVGVCRGSEGR